MIYKIALINLLLFSCFEALAAPNTLNFQAFIRKPDGSALQESSVNFRIKYKSPTTACTVYIEDFLNVSMAGSNGNVSLKLGSGAQVFPAAITGITLFKTFSNSSPPAPLACAEGGAPYNPASTDSRLMSVEFIYAGVSSQKLDNIEINSVPNSMYSNESQNAEKLAGFAAALYTKFADFETCTGGKFLTYDGLGAFTCLTPSNASFSGSLAGDVTGTQGATVVSSLRSTPLSATAPTSGQYLRFDGTNWVPATLSLTAGTVTNVSSSNSYITVTNGSSTPSLALNVGTAANTVAAGDDSRITGAHQTATTLAGDLSGTLPNPTVATVGAKTATQIATSVDDTTNAVSAATVSTLVKRDGSGNSSFVTASATNFNGRNLLLSEPSDTYKVTVSANSALATNYNFVLPTTAGTSGQVLATDGSGNMSWVTKSGTVTNVTGTAPVSVASGTTAPVISMAAATTLVDGYLTSGNFVIFNNKLGTTTAHSGDVTGTYNAMSVDRIKGTTVTTTSLTTGNFLKYNGAAWVNSTPVIGDITNLTTSLSNKLDQSQMPVACAASETLAFSSPTGTWFCSTILIDGSQIATGVILAERLFQEVVKYEDGSIPMDDDKKNEDYGNQGVTIHYTDTNFSNTGIITLPAIGDVPFGWKIKIVRDSGTNLVINTKDNKYLFEKQDSIEIHRMNLKSVTIANMSDKNTSVWKIIDESPDCIIGKPCGHMANIYIGLMNGYQYFTTPANCIGNDDCQGGADTHSVRWADGSGNSASNIITGKTDAKFGDKQSSELANDYDDTLAAKFCDGLDIDKIADWYLPSIAEFDLLLQNKGSIEGFLDIFDNNNAYWTSVEADSTNAIAYEQSKFQYNSKAKTDKVLVRCVRRW